MCLFLNGFFALFGFFLDRFVRAVSFLLEADVNAREAGIAVHQTKVIVRLIVAAADGYKVIGTGGDASASGFAIGTYFALSSSPAYHHTAFIYSSCRTHIFTNSLREPSVKRLNALTLYTFAQAQLQCIFLFKPGKKTEKFIYKYKTSPSHFHIKRRKRKKTFCT